MSPSPFYSTGPRYGMRALTGNSNVSDIDAGFAALRDDAESMLGFIPPRVSALPTVGPSGAGALLDGQECYFVADAANDVVWRLRYNAASASPYRWECVGGGLIAREVFTAEAFATTSFADLATVGPTITLPALPNGGDFEVTWGAIISTSGAATSRGEMSPSCGTFGATSGLAAVLQGNTLKASVGRETVRFTVGGSPIVFKAQYRTDGSIVQFEQRYLTVRAVRVG